MAKELLIRKQKGTHSPQCTSYRIVEPAWRFTLETCDEDVTGVIKDDVGNTIATVSAGAPAIVSRLGLYNVCVTGNGMGALYVEWTSDTYVDQQCCNEVRKEFEQMLDDAIANVESKIPTSSVTVRGGENVEVTKSGNTYTVNATDTVTTLKAGNGISLQRNGYEYTVSSKVANIVAGENVSIEEGTESDGSPRFEISATDTKPDVDKAYVDQQIAAIVDKDTVTTLTAGNSIAISDSGTSGDHNYTVSVSLPITYKDNFSNTADYKFDGIKFQGEYSPIFEIKQVILDPGPNPSMGWVITGLSNKTFNSSSIVSGRAATEDQLKIVYDAIDQGDTDTVTTLVAGDGVSITDSGTGGNHNYTVKGTISKVGTSGTDQYLSITDGNNNRTWINFGDNLTLVQRSSDPQGNLTLNATDTKTTLTAGDGISISDSGTDGNHIYTVKGAQASTPNYSGKIAGKITNFDGTAWQIVAGENVNFTADAVGEYITNLRVNATNTVTTLTAGNGISISDSGTGGNHNYDVELDNEIKFFSEDGRTKSLVCERGIQTVRTSDPNTGEIICGGFSGLGDGYSYCSLLENSIDLRNVNVQENKDDWLRINSGSILFMINGNQKTKLTSEFLTGLSNKTWTDSSFTSGRAATEDQLKVLADRIAALEARL